MTWNFLAVGRREDIKKHIVSLPRVPACVRELVFAGMDKVPPKVEVFAVESSGHLDESGGSLKLTIRVKQVFSAIEGGRVVGD